MSVTTYRAYIRVTGADDGRPLGEAGLEPLCENLNAHVREADEQGWQIGYNPFSIRTHLGKPVLRMDVDAAWQARLCVRIAHRFLRATGWKYRLDLNANTSRAM